MKKPIISIVTPTFNSIRYIAACVDSVRQSFKRIDCVDYEHVIADGGSTDGTLEFLRKQPGIVLVEKKDKGMYEGLNNAIEAAKGQFIGHLNSDEQYNPEGLKQAIQQLLETGADGVFGSTIMVNEALEFIQLFKQIVVPNVIDTHWCMPVQSCSLLYKKSLWLRAPYNTSYRVVADHVWFRHQMEQGMQLVKVKAPIGIFTWHPSSISNTYGKTKPEDALADINRKSFSIQLAKKYYRFKKLLLGGYCCCPVEYEIIQAGTLNKKHIKKPALKVPMHILNGDVAAS